MKSNRLSEKTHAILEALAEGRSCTQILVDDPTLTYRDIFRAAAEMPENQRRRKGSEQSRKLAESGQIRSAACEERAHDKRKRLAQ